MMSTRFLFQPSRWARGVAIALALSALPLQAQANEVVNLYTSREPQLIEPLLKKFTAKTGIAVDSIFINNGLIERLEAEGSRSPADAVLLVDVGQLQQLADKGLTQTLPLNSAIRAVPSAWREPKNQWVALSTRARVIYAHKDLPIQTMSYAELADPKWRGKICIRSGQHPYNTGLISAMIAHEGMDKTTAWLTAVKANLARKPAGGDRDVARDILGGICDVGVANSYYVGQMRTAEKSSDNYRWGNAITVILPTFANGKTHVNVSGIAITRHAPNAKNAQALVDFMLAKEAQEFYAKANFEYPVISGVALSPEVSAFGTLKPDDLPITEVAKYRAEASILIDQVGFDR